jgi:hypothetical protein
MPRQISPIFTVALTAVTLSAISSHAADVLPKTALGEWCMEDSSPCKPDDITEPMVIRPRELSNYMDYEADGVNCRIERINKVTGFFSPPSQWRVDLSVDCSNGKDKWHRYRGRMYWHLTSERLIIVTPPDGILIYVRSK